MVRIYHEILLGHKKDETLSFLTAWLDTHDILLSEIKDNMNKQNRNRLTDTENRLMAGCQRRGGLGAWVKKAKGWGSPDWQLRNRSTAWGMESVTLW